MAVFTFIIVKYILNTYYSDGSSLDRPISQRALGHVKVGKSQGLSNSIYDSCILLRGSPGIVHACLLE